jgi:uncharacterized phage infection (PIP) family protein YhgE
VQDIEGKLTSIAAKLDKLPYEAIGTDLTTALATLAQTLKSAEKMVNRLDTEITPGLKTTLDGLHGTLATADGMLKNTNATLVGTDAPAQQELRDALQRSPAPPLTTPPHRLSRAASRVATSRSRARRNPNAQPYLHREPLRPSFSS